MMDHNKPVLNYEDFIAYVDCQKAIILLKDALNRLEYTGQFNDNDEQNAIALIESLRRIIDKKLIDQ